MLINRTCRKLAKILCHLLDISIIMDATRVSNECDCAVLGKPYYHMHALSEDDTVELYDVSFHSN